MFYSNPLPTLSFLLPTLLFSQSPRLRLGRLLSHLFWSPVETPFSLLTPLPTIQHSHTAATSFSPSFATLHQHQHQHPIANITIVTITTQPEPPSTPPSSKQPINPFIGHPTPHLPSSFRSTSITAITISTIDSLHRARHHLLHPILHQSTIGSSLPIPLISPTKPTTPLHQPLYLDSLFYIPPPPPLRH